MARFNHNYHSSSTKLVFLTSCAGLLGVALIADFLWTSSYSSVGSAYLSVASNWALEKSGIIAVPNATAKTDDKVSTLTKCAISWISNLSFHSMFHLLLIKWGWRENREKDMEMNFLDFCCLFPLIWFKEKKKENFTKHFMLILFLLHFCAIFCFGRRET